MPTFLPAWTRPDRAFLAIALVFGTALVLLIPPFQSADEPYHFLRAYQITEGEFVSRQTDTRGFAGGYLPISLYELWLPFSKIGFHPDVKASVQQIRDAMRIPLQPQARIFITFPNTAHYCPTCYVPQCLGIALGRVLHLPPLAMLYLGREANLLFWILLGFFALRSAPAIARPLFLLLLMPMSLYVASTLSADPSTNAEAILFTALICKYFNSGPHSIGRKAFLLLLVLSVPLCVSKLVYVPLLALLLLIPARNFGGTGKFMAKFAALAAICAALLLSWVRASSNLDTRNSMSNNVSARAQFQLLEQHPTHFAALLGETLQQRGWSFLQSYVGVIGWLDMYLPAPVVVGYVLLLLAACWWCEDQPPLPSPILSATAILPAVIISFLAIALLDYLYWSPVGFPFIDGIHGRYLIPLTPAIFILACSVARRLPQRLRPHPPPAILNAATILISLGICSYFLIVVWNRYYG
ncbi:MAG TPA: DUF2142 domain-containing protein [Tepidisphaeraceae bacterium]|jgi:uncharacterized membrane protein|nr:DUF2142 domain-containing protein [Tepidisphaeraceae bacterium]